MSEGRVLGGLSWLRCGHVVRLDYGHWGWECNTKKLYVGGYEGCIPANTTLSRLDGFLEYPPRAETVTEFE